MYAFNYQYYAHREKLRLIGRENELETMNRKALQLARTVADETNTLMAGNICNTTIYAPNEEAERVVYDIFKVRHSTVLSIKDNMMFFFGFVFKYNKYAARFTI